MVKTHKEQISSLLDGELNSLETAELLEALEKDQSLNQQFDRYALIRGALNEDVVCHESFLKGVQDRLLIEPTVLLPNRVKRKSTPYLGVALAASLAVLSVIIFDRGAFNDRAPASQSVASLEAQVDQLLILEEQRNEELVRENALKVQRVTFEK